MPVGIDQHLAGAVAWRGAAGLDHGAQRGGLVSGFELGEGLINVFHDLSGAGNVTKTPSALKIISLQAFLYFSSSGCANI